ncbi:unnamed protein product [Ilex paraguariensis]|uniref:Uncharacterized protein n=1 Tax=Ilex paraguariensis TaxID=185542 RepID=A0ABC8RW64_9AQUA
MKKGQVGPRCWPGQHGLGLLFLSGSGPHDSFLVSLLVTDSDSLPANEAVFAVHAMKNAKYETQFQEDFSGEVVGRRTVFGGCSRLLPAKKSRNLSRKTS